MWFPLLYLPVFASRLQRGFHGKVPPARTGVSPPGVRSVRQQIVSLFCPRSCQLRAPPAQSPRVHGHRHPGATSVGRQPGGRVWLPSFHPSSFSTRPQGLSRPHPLAVGPCHLSLPAATLWNGIQKSAILVSALVGRLGSPAQNSRERQNIRATVGKITAPLNDRLCLSGTKRLTDCNRGHMVFRNAENTGLVGSGDMPGERSHWHTWEDTMSCLLGIKPRACAPWAPGLCVPPAALA